MHMALKTWNHSDPPSVAEFSKMLRYEGHSVHKALWNSGDPGDTVSVHLEAILTCGLR